MLMIKQLIFLIMKKKNYSYLLDGGRSKFISSNLKLFLWLQSIVTEVDRKAFVLTLRIDVLSQSISDNLRVLTEFINDEDKLWSLPKISKNYQ